MSGNDPLHIAKKGFALLSAVVFYRYSAHHREVHRGADLRRSMKRFVIAAVLSGFLIPGFGLSSGHSGTVYAQKKEDRQKKDPVGPPVVKDKGKGERPKDPPKKDKKH